MQKRKMFFFSKNKIKTILDNSITHSVNAKDLL